MDRGQDTPRLVGAIVGFGTIAQGHAAGYASMADVHIAAVVDPVLARRRAAEARMPGLRTYGSVEDLLLAERVDFVDICCPPAWHADAARSALNLGIDVLCEKPLVIDLQDLFDLRRAAELSGRVVFPCHNYKYSPAMSFLRSTIQEAGFGDVVTAHFRTYRSGHARGVPEWDPDWRRNRAVSGGGIVQDHGWHSVYLACELVGDAPVAVSCLAGEMGSGSLGTEDTALITLHFDDFTRVTVELSWLASFRETTYFVVGTDQSVFVHGDDVVHERSRGALRQRQRQRHRIVSDFDDPLHSSWFREMFGAFRVALDNRQADHLREAFITATVIDAAYRSAAEGGRPIDVTSAIAAGFCGPLRDV